eukprot:scaffold123289_cov96-Phaeocystis_antarctica.AAC.1
MLAPALTRRLVKTCWAQTARCSSSACYTGVSTGKPLYSARGRLPLARRRCGAVLRRLYLVGLSTDLVVHCKLRGPLPELNLWALHSISTLY